MYTSSKWTEFTSQCTLFLIYMDTAVPLQSGHLSNLDTSPKWTGPEGVHLIYVDTAALYSGHLSYMNTSPRWTPPRGVHAPHLCGHLTKRTPPLGVHVHLIYMTPLCLSKVNYLRWTPLLYVSGRLSYVNTSF